MKNLLADMLNMLVEIFILGLPWGVLTLLLVFGSRWLYALIG